MFSGCRNDNLLRFVILIKLHKLHMEIFVIQVLREKAIISFWFL